jgi:Ca2+-binding RTX toxin-like protein
LYSLYCLGGKYITLLKGKLTTTEGLLTLALVTVSYILLSTTVTGELLTAVTRAAWADHGNNHFDPEHNDLERDKDAVQDLYGLNIIRGEGMIEGTNSDDFIVGSLTADSVIARDGNDEIQTFLDIDQVYGGDGDDTIQGGTDGDQLFGQNGEDNVAGGTEDDLVVGGPGDDHLFGGPGDDQLKGNSGADFFDCGDDIDEVKDYNPAQGDILESNCEIVFSNQ